MTTQNEILKQHVTLDVECLDRIYVNGYIPKLQTGGQLVSFLQHLGNKIPSPALLGRLTAGYKSAVEAYAKAENVPILQFATKKGKGQSERKDDVVAGYRQRYDKSEGVVVIGVAQEKAYAFKASKRAEGKFVGFDYSRQSVAVNHYYFYVQDDDFGPAFIKVCSYAPYAVKLCLNGHEWVKRQLQKQGSAFESLDNGFLTCADPQRLQSLCDELEAAHIQAFFAKWQRRIPWFLSEQNNAAGFDYRLSLWQVEVSRTQVFAQPAQGRQWFEAVIRDNLDVGRPDRIQLVFDRRVTAATPGLFRTRIVQEGVNPSLHADYKKSHIKQYFKEQRALRTEMTINDPKDFDINKDLSNLSHLQQLGRQLNRRLLDAQHVSFDTLLSSQSLTQFVQPSVTPDGQPVPALHFGQPRIMALLQALTSFSHLFQGFTNQTLRQQVADLLALDPAEYTTAQMSYDLRRLRLKGLLTRLPHSYRYQLTHLGRQLALLFSKLDARIFRRVFAALDPQPLFPDPICQALTHLDSVLDSAIFDAIPEISAT